MFRLEFTLYFKKKRPKKLESLLITNLDHSQNIRIAVTK